MKPLTLITKPLPLNSDDALLARLNRVSRVACIKPPLSKHPLLAKADALLTFVTDRIDREVLKKATNLKVLSNFGVGYDNIDVKAARDRGITVCNTPDVLTNATAEFTIALLFAAARRFKEGAELIRARKFTGWEPGMLLGRELAGARLGVIGLGRIGSAVAHKAHALGMDVLGCIGPHSHAHHPKTRSGIPLAHFKWVLSTSDFISIHCPLNPKTHRLFRGAAFRLMKPGAILVNTARGEIIDEKALLRALAQKTVAAAALDVFEHEPRLREALRKHPRVLVLPHLGSATETARRGMTHLALQGIIDVLGGRTPANRVD